MQCGMCVKHAPGSCISNRDLDFSLFRRLTPAFPGLEALVLNGIGEPLLHPRLVEMVALAKGSMPSESWIGFQTNGLLLSHDLSERLLAAGLNRLCISVDDTGGEAACAGTLLHVSGEQRSPLAMVRQVCTRQGLDQVRLGAEIVLTRETLPQLPELIVRLANDGADFIIGSHLLAYHGEAEAQSLFNSCTVEAQAVYRKWRDIARTEGLNFNGLTARSWIAPRGRDELRLQQFYREMLAEAREQTIWLHVHKLDAWDDEATADQAGYLTEAEAVAARLGLELSLPPLTATTDRGCGFIEAGALFIDVDGAVMPCHPLWHTHSVYMDGEAKHLKHRSFGSVADRDLLEIWQSREYREFRQAVLKYDYPFCHSCALGPCPDITGESTPFVNDCFGITVPCGHCLWCFDAVRCL